MRKTSLALAALSLSLLGVAADARHGDHGKKHGAKLLVRTADTNGSGDVTAEEWQTFLDGLTVDESGAVDLSALAGQLPVRPTTRGQRHRARERDEDLPSAEEVLGRVLDHDGDGTVDVADIQAIFDDLDQDGDGALDAADRPERVTRTRMGRRTKKAGRFIAQAADSDASGDVTEDEWQSFLDALGADENGAFEAMTLLALLPEPAEGTRLAEKTDEERAAKLARVVDRDRDDVLELEDLDAIFDKLDRDEDGALSAEELARRRPV